MKKNILIAAGLFLLIIGLAAITTLRIKKWEGSLGGKESIFGLKSFDIRGLSEQLKVAPPVSTETFQEFISPDGKLRIKYPLDWWTITQKDILRTLVPEEWAEDYDLQALLMAGQGQGYGQLIVYGGRFDLGTEQIIEEMKKIVESYDWQIKIIKSDIKENEGIFETEYQIPDSPAFRSKEKILRDGEDVFIITLLVLESERLNSAEETDFIFNSAEFLTEK